MINNIEDNENNVFYENSGSSGSSGSIYRTNILKSISSVYIDNEIHYKLHSIATITIHSRPYFKVFRRYNSPNNIVIEDNIGDFHFHKDSTSIRISINNIMCLSETQYNYMHVTDANTIIMGEKIDIIDEIDDIIDMTWDEIHKKYNNIFANIE